ncbi:OmpA family protein [Aureliella helgolandensis]|uniref:Putative lipoprotein YiaD n=1 Tax=Aureliella helgolandensis TaxID=2527968 RepID=A0A518G211_9BACT|nr:OmpA family protein [Aureliella helgolandensis]QDV22656.1 putative lipoprotein YiaD precursor [Aureliella helgolandensis]
MAEHPFQTAIHKLSQGLFRNLLLVVVVFGMLSGCNRNPYAPGGWPPNTMYPQPGAATAAPYGSPPLTYAPPQTAPQLAELQRRVQQLDDNNRQLTTQLAQAQQQSQAFRERADLLAQQLQDSVNQNKQLLASSQQIAQQARGLQDSMNMRGGARLTANSSLPNATAGLQISGASIIPDGDVLRIRISSDQMFAPGSAQLTPASSNTLDQIATALLQRFSRQRVVIEGHTDNAQSFGGFSSAYELSGAQAQVVMDQLVRRNGVPVQQVSVAAQGPNRPIADNNQPAGRAENRRIEIVVTSNTF